MSRRKQSKPRQIKRSIGDLEEGEDHPPDDLSLSEEASDQEDSAECDSSPLHAPLHSEGPRTTDITGTAGTDDHEEEEKFPTHSSEKEEEAEPYWDGPDELHLNSVGGVKRILLRQDLAPDTTWGPYSGPAHSGQRGEGQDGEALGLTLVSTDTELWWKKLPVTSSHTAANCTIYSQGENLYRKVTQAVHMGACLLATLPEPVHTETHNAPVKEEPELPNPEIQLLPQQAGMAAILASAVINKDIFLCKACGIWYRSVRNLQAHLMYYCASRKQEPASPPLDYPKEHVCAFAHCNKSCPSASALEIHMRAHSGESEDCGVLGQVCGFAVDSPALLQQHVRMDLEVRSLALQQNPSSSESLEPARVASPEGSPPSVRVKEEPQTDSENETPPSRCGSPKTPPSVQVKVELPSATPGSSPGPQGAGGTGLLPQASEILAKMSEMVHIRLKQGHTPATPVCHTLASPVHKGATCFECNITFNNINNFYVHKRLYCSSRQRHGDTAIATPTTMPTAMPQVKEGAESSVSAIGLSSSPDTPTPCSVSEAQPGATAVDTKPVDVKREDPGLGELLCSEVENSERVSEASEGSQSPGGSGEDADDSNTTFCQACNIRFSRHDNYTIHKRFYCASRHPSNPQPHAGNTSILPQPVHKLKRKKMYEIHMAHSHTMARPGSTLDPVPPLGLSSTPSCHTEGDGPIDLCKRPRTQDPGSPTPTAPLSDYHKCMACSISFNSIENYLAHKAYYCSAPLQQRPLQPLSKLFIAASPSPGPLDQSKPSPVPTQYLVPSPPTPGSEGASPHRTPPSAPPIACPYCPKGRAVMGDLMEHVRTVHSLVRTWQPSPGRVSPGQSNPCQWTEALPPRVSPGLKHCPHSVNGRASPSSPLLNGSPCLAPHTPPPATSPGAAPLTVSPVPGAMKEVGANLLENTPSLAHAHMSPKAVLISPLQNGSPHYCRLCNIRFSSLSTFIAHKKYYCSSHSAEHVK